MSYLFDTDALSEVMRKRPLPRYLSWLRGIPREDQFASAVSIAELYEGAHRSRHRDVLLRRIDEVVVPAINILPFDLGVAKVFGRLQADLIAQGLSPGDADVQIAATAVRHGLALVTGNLRHHERIPELRLDPILALARRET